MAKSSTKNAAKSSAKPAKKAATKATKAETKGESVSRGPGKVHFKILACLAKSKTVLFKGSSKAGELSYKAIAEEAGIAINNLTQYLAKQSGAGTPYPNSLTSLGMTKVAQYETTNAAGDSVNTPLLYSITEKGKAALATWQKEQKGK